MLTDTALRNLKPKAKPYKASDRDGMNVTVSPGGTVTFRYDYRLNGRRETLTIGRYGPAGISLAMAREKLLDAKRMVAQGISPSLEKQRAKRRLTAAKSFGDMLKNWLADARMADSTRSMRKSIIDRDILPVFENRLLTEITPDDLRALCAKVKGRGAPATAVHIRDIVKQVYAFAILHGEKVENPADDVKAASIATFVPKDRALTPTEIRLAFHQLESIAAYPTIRLALRLVLLTLVRKSELIEATWNEVDFENATWTISKQRMKGRNPHVVYLSRQALDIFIALHTCAAGSRFVLPSRYDIHRCMSHATLNRITQLMHRVLRKRGCRWSRLLFTTCAGQDPHYSMRWVSIATGSRSAWRMRMGVHRARSTTRPSTRSSGAICCRSGQTWSMPGSMVGLMCRSCCRNM